MFLGLLSSVKTAINKAAVHFVFAQGPYASGTLNTCKMHNWGGLNHAMQRSTLPLANVSLCYNNGRHILVPYLFTSAQARRAVSCVIGPFFRNNLPVRLSTVFFDCVKHTFPV